MPSSKSLSRQRRAFGRREGGRLVHLPPAPSGISGSQHAASVAAWLERSAKDLPPEALLRLFEAALSALWVRTKTALGEVTLTAITERVLLNASEKFPFFSTLEVEASAGLQCRELRARIDSVDRPALLAGIRFALVEFLTVLGNLTAEILTLELHAALSNVSLPKAARPRNERQSRTARASKEK